MRRPDPAKRARILEAARERFYRYGVRKTSMQEIAADAAMAVGTLYLYFRDKKEVLVACADAFEETHRHALAKALDGKRPAEERLRRYLIDRFRATKATREGSDHAAEVARAVIEWAPKRLASETDLMIQAVASLLQQGRDAGSLPSADPQGDIEPFLYSIAWFFPIAGREPPQPVTEKGLLKVVDWFIERWRRPNR